MLDPDDRYHIESRLGRALTPDDLAQVGKFDDLSRGQLAIVERLVPRGILASKYVHAVVPSADFSEVRELVYNIQTYINKRFPPERLPKEHLYGPVLGRPLTDEERARAESLQTLSQAQLAVAQQLSRRDAVFGQLYLGDIVKSATASQCEIFAQELHRSDRP
jgi:hypothetical protein